MTLRASVGTLDDPEEALAGAAELGVDVVLEGVHVFGLLERTRHLVAVVLLERVELAERAVLDEVVDHDPQPRPPGTLDPPPVGALVGERLVARPAREARPALRAVRARRTAGREEVLGDGTGAVRVVVDAVAHRHRNSVRAPGTPAMEAAAEELERTEMDVVVDEAADSRLRVRSLERLAGDVHLDVREGGAALGGRERPAGGGRVDLDEPAEWSGGEVLRGGQVREAQRAAVIGDAPVRRRARGVGRRNRIERGARHVPAGSVEHVAAERGRLHSEGCGCGRGRGRCRISERISHDEAAAVRVAQRVAAVRVRVDVNGGCARCEQRTGGCARGERDDGSSGHSLQEVPPRSSQRQSRRPSPQSAGDLNACSPWVPE